MRWKVVELWTVPAADMLAAGDVGLVPWVPLAQFEGSPGPIFQECRMRIDRDAPADEHENLLAVTQILAGLRYNDSKLFQILGGREAMIESPVLQEFVAERTREIIIEFLVGRFGPMAQTLRSALGPIDDDAKLRSLARLSATCPNLESFKEMIPTVAKAPGERP